MEILLHYIWRHRMYPLHRMTTNKGETVEVIDPGLHNRNAGPDFFNAKIKVDGMLWVGNVEIHDKASDWFLHGHDKDEAYDNVILHVVGEDDMPVRSSRGETMRQMQMDVPEYVTTNYSRLLREDRFPPCHEVIGQLQKLTVHSWMSTLQTERLEQKTEAIIQRLELNARSWEKTYFQTLARNFGFGINGEAFETWASLVDLTKAGHHRNELFQLEAMFIGQAGLLDRVEERYAKEYAYLKHKFGLQEMDASLWRYLRTRPQNFPHVRLMQLAKMFHEQRTGLSRLLDCEDVKAVGKLLGMKGAKLSLVVINTVIPILFAYGRTKSKENLCDRSFCFLEEIDAEDNNIVRMWRECGLEVKTAGDSQALIQLKKEYCDKKECLRCRFGFEYLSLRKNSALG